jgi:hypothetical protein
VTSFCVPRGVGRAIGDDPRGASVAVVYVSSRARAAHRARSSGPTCRREHVQRIARGLAGRQHVRTVRALLPSATPTVARLASTAQACGAGGGALALQQAGTRCRRATGGALGNPGVPRGDYVSVQHVGCGAATQQRGLRASAPWRPAGCKRNSAATLRLVACRLGRWRHAQSWCRGGFQVGFRVSGFGKCAVT